MSYPLPPGGLFPLTTAPTGRSAGGAYPLPSVLADAIKSLNPTAYWKLDEASGNLADAMSGGYTATVTGSPTYGVAAPSPIGRGVTFSGTGQYGTTASVPVPTASMSALAFFSTTDATAATRILIGRRNVSQHSWSLQMSASHVPQFVVYQAGGSYHAVAGASTPTAGTVANDGRVRMAAGTFDGTTIWGYGASAASSLFGASSTTLTGTWHPTSTAELTIACRAAGTEAWPGTLYPVLYWKDRVLTAAELRWLAGIAFGG